MYHQYVIRSLRRDELRALLQERGIDTLVHYTPPVHQHPAYRRYHDSSRPLPETERASGEVVSLPMHPLLTPEDAERVAEEVVAAASPSRGGQPPSGGSVCSIDHDALARAGVALGAPGPGTPPAGAPRTFRK